MELDETQGLLYDTDRNDLKVKVYRGLYVSEANDLDDAFIDEDVSRTEVVSDTFFDKLDKLRKTQEMEKMPDQKFGRLTFISNFFKNIILVK